MSGRRQEVLDYVTLLEGRAPNASASPTLSSVGIESRRLDVPITRHRYHQVLVCNEVLDVELAFVGDDPGPACIAELLLYLPQFGRDYGADLVRVGQNPLELANRVLELFVLLADLVLFECRQPPQGHVEDVLGLDFRQSEPGDQTAPCLAHIRGSPYQFDDLLDVVKRDDQAFEDVQALTRLFEAERRAPSDHLYLVGYVLLDDLGQVQRAGDA